jgi:predicted DCC family thiol-disulfide oxidoreductase YuxK
MGNLFILLMKANMDEILPLLIYDGTCDFCYYWVKYWHKLTGDSVIYKPYQEVGDQYPQFSAEDYRRSIKYVAPDGKIASAAEASFLTVSHAPGKSFWLTLYRRLPGFAFISEKVYAVIASHRSFFYTISLWLWGRDYEPPQFNIVSWLFLRGLGLLFLVAFISFGMQAPGLIGSHGIIPVAEFASTVHTQLGALGYWLLPMLFWFNASDLMIQVTCWSGVLLSLLLVYDVLPRTCLVMLYILYLSLSCAGQFFMSFQWDMLLLETGVLAIFLVGWPQHIGIWLLRWLLFRFIFVAGMVKIMSGDPAWQTLSALSIYFVTEPLPTPLAWYAAHLPKFLLTMGTFAALFVELVMPFFIFFPRRLRFFAAFSILLMQILIFLTGNYNFFNLTTMLLCLVLFDDAALRKILPQRFTRHFSVIPSRLRFKSHRIAGIAVGLFVVLTVAVSIDQFYLRFGGTPYKPLLMLNDSIAPLRLVSTYGPFSIITTKRYEIIFEGSSDDVNWVEYDFKYKPGAVNKPLTWNVPFQPRLDWQMWFAALGDIDNNKWVLNFMGRLLENSPAVLDLLADNPFPNTPPKYVRAQFYDYTFTNIDERADTGVVWKRRLLGLYQPEVSLDMNITEPRPSGPSY